MIQKPISRLCLIAFHFGICVIAIADSPSAIRLRCMDLHESSGLAWSLRDPKLVWTHNDSGDSARLFCFDGRSGKETGRVELMGLKAIDWEAMSSFRGTDGKPKLIVADCGDNQAKRKHILLHIFDEPDPNQRTQIQRHERITIQLQHAGGPVDCEAIATDPISQNLILVSKRFLPGAIVETVPISELGEERDVIAKRLASVPLPMVTGIDVDANSGDIWISSYFNLFRFPKHPGDSLRQQFGRQADILPVPKLKQIEAIAVDPEGIAWVTTEGDPPMLARAPE